MVDPGPWIRVVVVAYNPGAWLEACVAALARQDDPGFEVVIVDNACTDGSVAGLCLPDARFRILSPGRNLGFAAGSNLGAAGARTAYLAMLNPDALPNADWLGALRRATVAQPDVAMYGSTQLMADAPDRLDGAGDCYSIFGIAWRGGYGCPAAQVTGDIDVFSPCAAGAVYRRDWFEAVGGFAEDFFCYLEDVDLGFRLRLRGCRAVQLAQAKLYHAGSASTGRDSAFTLFHSARNGLFLMIRCVPGPLLALTLPLYFAAQLWLSLRAPTTAGARLRGLVQGMRAVPKLLGSRASIIRSRHLGWWGVARLLVWDLRAVSRRQIVALSRQGSGMVVSPGPGRHGGAPFGDGMEK